MLRILLSFDIACPRRRRRAGRYACDHGERVQESVFDLWITPADWQQLQRRLDDPIDPVQDQWRVWPLCANDLGDAVEIGQAAPHPATQAIVV
jgi:CRISPR-associated protein Cas2